ncbi:MAG: hypothetical protein KJZ86_23770 [Caldilineaceae bacterium]|nr:hypothetical protein [Caldilineaceae bacterium]HRJ44059.1 hypothetical protein [Caldilineaceae bacterium]
MTTLEQVLETVEELPLEQRGMLADILHSRYVAERRREIAADAQIALELFRGGKLKAQSAVELIAELRTLLEDDADSEEDDL